MLNRIKLIKDRRAVAPCLLCMIVSMLLMVGLAIFMFFFIQMLVVNIVPIAIAIVLIICLPILAKAYYTKKTGREYPSQKGGGQE